MIATAHRPFLTSTSRCTIAASVALVLSACGGGDDAAQEIARKAAERAATELSTDAPENIEEAVGELTKALSGEGVETVSTELLREMLPKEMAGLKRTNLSATKSGAMGIKISSAEAEYAGKDDDDNESMTVNISDIGAMQGMARMGLNWLDAEVYEEDENGFNRTVDYKGHRAIESFESDGPAPKGNKLVFVADRFLIDVNTTNLPFETIDEVLATLPVEELAKLAGG